MLPLAGIRVLELGYGIAAPVAARNLAQFGADVIRVESRRRPDSLRLGGAGWLPRGFDPSVRQDTLPALNFSSAEKRSLGLEIDHEDGRAVFEQPGRGSRCRDHEHERTGTDRVGSPRRGPARTQARPRVRLAPGVRIRWSVPDVPHLGSQPLGGVRCGLPHRMARPRSGADRIRVSGLRLGARRDGCRARRTSTAEGDGGGRTPRAVAVHDDTLVPRPHDRRRAALGTRPSALGNRDADRAPQGVYPAKGTERWVALSVQDSTMWRSLCRVPGLESLGNDARFATLEDRVSHHDALDEALAAWTIERTDWEAATELQWFGVAASPVLDSWDLVADPQLAAREFFHALPHARFPRDLVFGQAVRLSETPPAPTRRAGVRRTQSRGPPRARRHRRRHCRRAGRRGGRARHRTRRRRARASVPPLAAQDAAARTVGLADVRSRHRDDAQAGRGHGTDGMTDLDLLGDVRVLDLVGRGDGPGRAHARRPRGRRRARRTTRRLAGARTPPLVTITSGDVVSAHFAYTAAGKRSVTIDLDAVRGQDLFHQLVSMSDVLLTDAAIGELEGVGLDYATLHRLHPRLVYTSLTPFGLTGPRRRWRGSDLVGWATSGAMPSIGDADRPPLAPGGGLVATWPERSNATMGSVAALMARRDSGARPARRHLGAGGDDERHHGGQPHGRARRGLRPARAQADARKVGHSATTRRRTAP